MAIMFLLVLYIGNINVYAGVGVTPLCWSG